MSATTTNPITSALNDFAQKPIPELNDPTGWRNKGITVQECGEPLVKIIREHQDIGIEVVPMYANKGVPGAERDCFVRQGVLEKLTPVGKIVKHAGSSLQVLDALRPPPVQGTLFWALLVQVADQCGLSSSDLKNAQAQVPDSPEYGVRFNLTLEDLEKASRYVNLPPLSTEERKAAIYEGLLQFGQRYVSIPSLSGVPAPHFTGGAVDVGIKGLETGVEFDEFTDRASMRYYEQDRFSDHETADEREYRSNRRILFNLMSSNGFSCFAFEAWHFGEGDPLSVVCSGSGKTAKYGIKFPQEWQDRPWAKSIRFEN